MKPPSPDRGSLVRKNRISSVFWWVWLEPPLTTNEVEATVMEVWDDFGLCDSEKADFSDGVVRGGGDIGYMVGGVCGGVWGGDGAAICCY
jgi:hypothetical protein